MSHPILKAWNAFLAKSQNVQASFNMLKTIEAEHARIHDGKAFTHAEKHSVSSGSTLDHLIVCSDSQVHLGAWNFVADNGPCDIFLYEAPFTDANSYGTEETFYNNNRQSSEDANFALYVSPFIDANSLGTQLDYNFISETAGGPIKASAGEGQSAREWVLDPTKNYLVRFINNTGDALNAESRFFAYKIN